MRDHNGQMRLTLTDEQIFGLQAQAPLSELSGEEVATIESEKLANRFARMLAVLLDAPSKRLEAYESRDSDVTTPYPTLRAYLGAESLPPPEEELQFISFTLVGRSTETLQSGLRVWISLDGTQVGVEKQVEAYTSARVKLTDIALERVAPDSLAGRFIARNQGIEPAILAALHNDLLQLHANRGELKIATRKQYVTRRGQEQGYRTSASVSLPW